MPSDIRSILTLEVPIIVLLGERLMKTSDVISLIPGAIVELPKNVDEELSLLVNNRAVGTGVAVKVGENFGLKVTFIGDLGQRIKALGGAPADARAGSSPAPSGVEHAPADAALAGKA